MRRLYEVFCLFEEFVTKILLCCIIVLVFLAALLRSVGYPVNWSVDIAQLLFAWAAFFGADIAMRKDKLMGVEMFVGKMSGKMQHGLKVIHYLFIILFLCGVVVFGLKLCVENYARTFQTMEISYSWVTLSAPVGATLMIITSMIKLKQLLNSITTKQAEKVSFS